MRVNGLYGHVRRNDARSLVLFAAFVLAFHLLALLSLIAPLAIFDQSHAPLSRPFGYLARWVPLVTLLGAGLFATRMAWHVRHVRVKTAFQFVDTHDEPRLCRIVEPLAIAAGLPCPYVAVIDNQALNAFACGIRRKDAVLVFTRGLIDELDDEELAAVAAHEISHVLHGDIRLIAAANICLASLKLVAPRAPVGGQQFQYFLALPIIMFIAPALFVVAIVASFLRKLAVDASHLTRLLIASSREFVADAEAVRLTQNPAALVAALGRIDGRSAIPHLTPGQDAMMIDGAHEGPFATHPAIAERIRAIVAVTGTMALVAPSRRDTRQSSTGPGTGFGRRRPTSGAVALAGNALHPSIDVASTAHLNRLGMTKEMAWGTVAALALAVGLHARELTRPGAVVSVFDPAPMNAFLGMAGQGTRCEVGGFVNLASGRKPVVPPGCDAAAMEKAAIAFAGQPNVAGLAAMNAATRPDRYRQADGSWGSTPPPAVQVARVRANRCFVTEAYVPGDWAAHPSSTLGQLLGIAESDALAVRMAATGREDRALRNYLRSRMSIWETVHRTYGADGIAAARIAFAGANHRLAVDRLATRLHDGGLETALPPLERAEAYLLTKDRESFTSCVERFGQTGRTNPPTF